MKIRNNFANTFGSMFLLILMALACEEEDCCVFPEAAGRSTLTGSWLLYERGYSPGSGYITEAVSGNPPRIITFDNNGDFSATVQGWETFTHYRVFEDAANQDVSIVALFETAPPDDGDVDTSKLQNAYSASFKEGRLILSRRWCIEGCHLAFRPI